MSKVKTQWRISRVERHLSEREMHGHAPYFGCASSGYALHEDFVGDTEAAVIAAWQAANRPPEPKPRPAKPELLVQPLLRHEDFPEIDGDEIKSLPVVKLRDTWQRVWLDLTGGDVLSEMFSTNDRIRVESSHGASIQSLADLRRSLKLYSRFAINPVTAYPGGSQPSERRFIAARFKNITSLDGQWSRLHSLSTELPLTLAIYSPHNMKVEAVFDCREASHKQLQKFANRALSIGADPSALAANHSVPIPNNVAANPATGAFQKLREAGISVDSNSTRMKNFVLFFRP